MQFNEKMARLQAMMRLLSQLLTAVAEADTPKPIPPTAAKTGSSAFTRALSPGHRPFIRADYTICCERHAETSFRPDPRLSEALAGPERRYIRERLGWR
jgi:hypothetical protein